MGKIIFVASLMLLSLGAFVIWQLHSFSDRKMHVIFCDVGQGDAILIKTPKGKYILIDGGPDRSVLNCLAKHMPFWQRKIDLLLLSHPHADHFYGMFYVLERYEVKGFATENLSNKTQAYDELLKQIRDKDISSRFVAAGDAWEIGDVDLRVVGPTEKYLKSTSPGGTIGESREFASLVLQISFGDFDVLLTGDSQVAGLEDAVEEMVGAIEILQSPHHGSATGLDEAILEKLDPELAVISVGDNRYGHPNKKILDLLEQAGIAVSRTDKLGAVEIISDGKNWQVNPTR